MSNHQLQEFAEKLSQSAESLKGRSSRLAHRQLAVVSAEIKRRSIDSVTQGEVRYPESTVAAGKVPPQFDTPEASAKRLQAIRKYHRKRKINQSRTDKSLFASNSTRWLDTLLNTLRDEASRHEQAAQNYARVPELFPLHIEHSARAFELNRIHDMLINYVKFIFSDENEPDGD